MVLRAWIKEFRSAGISSEERKNYTATLGNLLLLSMAINSSLQNDTFSEKKRVKTNAAGQKSRNGYSDGSHSEIEVSQQSTWGPKEIYERGMKLLTFMENRWGFKFKNDREKAELLFIDFEKDGDTARAS
ncbi:HNH endonuclease family protein [Geomonas nitrogeniifigens]|uniref:GmrSD restriction endonuclease domain-containing protein n=1 Tax=Geomonas diazotrophica TaxID=2843197 RepID=UPI001C2C5722|nr:DUF1524 domain-containing protein [Geomonas nitrogeniifigens]QXE87818.1 HNH endonuclease family protein [Geomonas nitrogeniifigens]